MLHVAVPSKNRAGKTRTQRVLPNSTFYVPDNEVSGYRACGIRNVVGVPLDVRGITATRNYIIRLVNEESDIVMVDDDVERQGYMRIYAETMKAIKLNEEQWHDQWGKAFDLARELGYRIWGVRTECASQSTYKQSPIRFRGYITASCMGIIRNSGLLFDESYPVKEDYEICLRCIREDGGILSLRYLFWQNSHWDDDGGCKDYRTHKMEKECIRRLLKEYPGMCRVNNTTGKPGGYAAEYGLIIV